MRVNGKSYRTVWMEGSDVLLIDQLKLPYTFEIFRSASYKRTCFVIQSMVVRGAGAIGATAGYAMAQAIIELHAKGQNAILVAKTEIEATRPTAQNLFYATQRVYNAYIKAGTVESAVKESEAIADEDVEMCRLIGEYGSSLIEDGARVETHCNAGWLAFVDNGSALSPIYTARDNGKSVFVWVDETRPRNQGAKLTAWELGQEGIECSIIPDNAGAFIMSQGKVDLMIVGADRIAVNGDVVNKIGTLEKAICAKEFGIPFYVAAPISTIDKQCETGFDVEIEQRDQSEVLCANGIIDDKLLDVAVSAPNAHAVNFGFDVTPAKYITGIITNKGIVDANEESISRIV